MPLIPDNIHVQIYPVDKPEYTFNGVSCNIVCNTKKMEENMF